MKNHTRKTLRIYLQAAMHYKGLGFLVILSVITASAVGILATFYLKAFFDVLTSQGGDKMDHVQELFKVLTMFAILEVGGWAFWRSATFSNTYFKTKVLADLSNSSFQYLHGHSFSFFDSNFMGSLVKRVKWFSRAFEVIADQIIWKFLPLIVNIILIVYILFTRNSLLGWGVLIWSLIFLVINFVFTKSKLKYDIRKAKKETETTAVLADTITNHRSVKLFSGYLRETRRFGKAIGELQGLRRFTWNLDNLLETGQGILVTGLTIGTMYLSVRLWVQNILTIGDIVVIQVFLFKIFHSVWDFGKVLRRVYEALADADEMTVILNTSHEITDIPRAGKLQVVKGEIEFEGVDFCYHKTRKVLDDFNLIIRSKERIALIGPSGSGKTTVVKMLLRMSDVARGRILIDDQDIARVSQGSLREKISLVPQNPILFHRSLMENIRYGKPRASNQEVTEAARKAHADEFISFFPEGYDTYVGERGVKLSGGERQRVAIARALLKNAPILVLDEATSSLDSRSERLIQEAIEELMKDKTVIVIAHRLSTIRKMDRILVVDRGRIIEEGTHQQLLGKVRGKYKELWELQSGGFAESI